MHKSLLVAALALATTSPPARALPEELTQLHEALHNGKATLELRLRGEYVDFETTPETDAETLRTQLGYRSGEYHGLHGYLEFENVSTLGNGDYNSGVNGQTRFGLIPDPALTQLNQFYLDGHGLRVGRQRLVFDNARFIGDVGWRQNDQTFSGASYRNDTLVEDLTLSAAYLERVHNIYGLTRHVAAPLLHLRYAALPAAGVSVFYYGVDEKSAPAGSWQHAGLRLDGRVQAVLYELAYARQQHYAEATAASVPTAAYRDVQLGYQFGPVTVKAQQEVLEKGFKTPLATLHAFNGWADRFLTTPAAGLKDTALHLLTQAGPYGLVLSAHDFRAEATRERFGQEVDAAVSRTLRPNTTLLLKAARFDADGSVAGYTNDTLKIWLQLTCKL